MKNRFIKSYLIDNRIRYICTNEYKFFLNKSNVIGVGLGYKITKGFSIKVFVIKKYSIINITPNNLISKIYKGIETDVIESGKIISTSLNQKIRPTLGGYSIGL